MYLKALQMIGFKSFAERTRLEFSPGITAIVGPNGCGKSNVLDAIRWVLGEQSAKALRGSEMADVIFNGTDTRKQIGMAEVSMTFADCEKELGTEFHEVTISRRVFRDGKSEYEVNKTPCRLRDIQQLFMDTGVGRSAYSIMEQGKIDKILSARPEDRREVFEEAAGITKYKSQKKEALRKLEHTESNLLRVGDIIKEVKRQIGSLQRQAGKARRYKELYEQLRRLEMRLGRHQMRELLTHIAALSADSAKLALELEEISLTVAKRDLQRAEDRTQAEQLEISLETCRSQRAEARAEFDRAQGRILLNDERLSGLQSSDETARMTIVADEERLKVQREQARQLEEALTLAQSDLLTARTAQQDLQQKAAQAAHAVRTERTTLAATASRLNQLETELQQLQQTLASRDAEKRTCALRLEAAETDRASLQSQLTSLEKQAGETQTHIDLCRNALEATRADLLQLQELLREVQKQRDPLRQQRDARERARVELQSKHDLLQRLQQSHEGFSSGVQRVLSASGSPALGGIRITETLSDTLHIQPGATRAVEALLAHAIQALILEDTASAETVIQFLATQQSDRIHLAPTQFPRPAASPRDERPESAHHFVQASGAAQRVLDPLLDRAYIVDSLPEALALKAQLPDATIATRSGDLISREGLLATGTVAGRTDLLDRKRQIEELAAQLPDAQTAVARADAALLENEEARKKAEFNLEQGREKQRIAQETYSTAEREGQMLRRQMEETGRKISGIETEMQRVTETDRRADERHASHVERREKLQAERAELALKRDAIEQSLPALAEEENTITSRLTEARVTTASLEEKINGMRGQHAPISGRIRELETALQTRRTEMETNAARKQQLQQENETLRGQLGTLEQRASELDQQLQKLQQQRTELYQLLERHENSLRELRTQQSSLQEKRSAAELTLARKNLDADNLRQRLLRTYQVNIDELLHTPPHLDEESSEPESTPDGDSETDPDEQSAESDSAQSDADNETDPEREADSLTPERSVTDAVSDADASSETDAVQTDANLDLQELSPEEWNQLEQEANDMRERLDAMGPVNLEAIAEYDELEQRHQFLETQQNDLFASRTDLLQAISQINKTTQTLFAETFARIRTNFQTTFTELFGGGKADLILSDESDPLDCGIEIVAKPPGKHPQSITLLSGGERTMTAVSLLFAIYMVKPSPFCVLDEMDAPLDESNIGRFTSMLGRFITQSQFLLITHNKKTIAMADAIYGVTMEENGVSKTVSVRFTRNAERERATTQLNMSEQPAQSGATPAAADVNTPTADADSIPSSNAVE